MGIWVSALKMATNLMMMVMVVPTFLLEPQRPLCETLSVLQTATCLTVLRVREAALLQTKTILTMMLARRGLGELLLLMLLLFEAESVSKFWRLRPHNLLLLGMCACPSLA